jgi:hypothetical protein
MRDLSALIKAYDIRGVVPDQWGPDLAREVGTRFRGSPWDPLQVMAAPGALWLAMTCDQLDQISLPRSSMV